MARALAYLDPGNAVFWNYHVTNLCRTLVPFCLTWKSWVPIVHATIIDHYPPAYVSWLNYAMDALLYALFLSYTVETNATAGLYNRASLKSEIKCIKSKSALPGYSVVI